MATENKALAVPEPEPPAAPLPEVATAAIKGDGALSIAATKDQVGAFAVATGSSSEAFQAYALTHLLNILLVGKDGKGDITLDTNAALAMLSAIGPTNEMEAMLAAQMVATHHLAMRQLNKHAYTNQLRQHEAHGNLANKFLRTFTTQMEALSRLRRGGKQIIEHVHIGDGGQAVFADTINQGVGGRSER